MNSEYVSVYKNAPFPRRRGVYSLLKRLRSLPFVNPRLYKKHRWAAGHHQYQASQRLNELGQPELAASALLESLATSITLF
ncbi:MAG: hypothetical protein J0I88_02235, partial [Chryseobacterium sp.]|nr:hypothetical protein [Chryseobacterium sp.]